MERESARHWNPERRCSSSNDETSLLGGGREDTWLVRMAHLDCLTPSPGLGKLIYATLLRKRGQLIPGGVHRIRTKFNQASAFFLPHPCRGSLCPPCSHSRSFCLLTMSHVTHTPLPLGLAWSFFLKFTWQTTWSLMTSHSNSLLPSKHSSNANSSF